MKLTFLGLGAAFNPAMENTNAFFSQDDELYLLDCGETAFGKLWNSQALAACSRVTVALTHLHCDHAGSLGTLISYCAIVLKKPVRVIHPLESAAELLEKMGIARGNYTLLPSLESPAGNGVSFRPLEVEHVNNMRCFGYVVKDAEKTIYYSGDAVRVPPEITAAFLKGEVDEIYQDTSLETGDHPTHGSLAELERTFAPEFRKRVYCIHLDRDYRETIKAKGFMLPDLFKPL